MAKISSEEIVRVKGRLSTIGTIHCPICGGIQILPAGDEILPLIIPNEDALGGFDFVTSGPIHTLKTFPLICKDCGFVMPFFVDPLPK